jgi:alpha-1,3-glucosyltransferase
VSGAAGITTPGSGACKGRRFTEKQRRQGQRGKASQPFPSPPSPSAGLLLLSIHAIEQGRPALGSILFTAVLNMKHLFLYLGPVYLVFLLRSYVLQRGGSLATSLRRLALLGCCVLAVCGASLGPFVALGQTQQLLARLFPFGRGLTHAYWAANAWALYCLADKVLAAALPRLGVPLAAPAANLAGGVVGVGEFAALPQVGAGAAAACVLLALLPCLRSIWRRPAAGRLPAAVAYAALCGFVFGYHVHEKAVLVALVPLGMAALRSPARAADFLLLAAAGCYSLLPLLFEVQEYAIKTTALVGFLTAAFLGIDHVMVQLQLGDGGKGAGAPRSGFWWPWQYALYCWGLVLLELFSSWVHPLLLDGWLPFLPLLLTSVYSALGVLWVWGRMCIGYVKH